MIYNVLHFRGGQNAFLGIVLLPCIFNLRNTQQEHQNYLQRCSEPFCLCYLNCPCGYPGTLHGFLNFHLALGQLVCFITVSTEDHK